MKRYILILAAVILAVPGLFAQTNAVVKELKGTVEIKEAGGAWRPARIGAVLNRGAYISTGFSSTAVLEVGPSRLTVSPLTRMQLAELLSRQGTLSTQLFLRVGKVKAEVKSAEGMRTDFTLKAPTTTAAVRGTEFEFDGLTVTVLNGVVFFSNSLGQARAVGQGEQSQSIGAAPPTTGEQEKDAEVAVVPGTGHGGAIGLVTTPGGKLAQVKIRWQ